MKNIKLILTDLDETVLNWQEPFEVWIRKYTNYFPKGSIVDCRNLEQWLNVSYEESHKLIAEFNRTLYFGALDPVLEAEKYIPMLYKEGFRFIGITAVDNDYWTQHTRRKNLEFLFPKAFIGIHCNGIGEPKDACLKLYRPTWWVEDKMRHAKVGAELGHKSFLMDYHFNENEHHPLVKRVKSWKDIYYCFTDDGCNLPGWIA
jgi:hypothetical protein